MKSGLFSRLCRLGKDQHAGGPRLLARLLRDEEGSYLLIVTLAMPVFIGLAGLATEGGLLFYNKRTLQSAADGAAYSAAIAYSYDTSADITTQAKAIVASYGFALGSGNNQANVSATLTTVATTGGTLPAVQVTISRPQTAIFSRINFPVISNSVSATAVLNPNTGNCLLALGNNPLTGNNDAPSAIAVQGTPTINCGVFTNSTDCTAAGSVSLLAGSVGSAGCISVTGSAFTQNDATLSDPYANVSVPTTSSAGSCAPTASSLCPGVYPSGISLQGGTWTLKPGIYILEAPVSQGVATTAFQVGPGTTVNGNGVTLVFTSATPNIPSSYPTGSNNPMMNIDSSATVNLTAPTTGPTAGFVMMGDSTMPLGTGFSSMPLGTGFSSSASATAVNLNGVVYLPNGFMSWGGNATTANGCRQFIVNTISLQGTPGLNNEGCSQKPIGSIVTLVQ